MLISAVRDDLCLAYANTKYWRGSDPPTEKLHGLGDLLAWLETAVGLPAAALHDIRSWARAHPRKAEAVFDDALALREALFRTFGAVAGGAPGREPDFAAVKGALAQAPGRADLARADGGYAWQLERIRPAAADLLAPVLWSAGDLLLAGARRRVRQCANDKCLWLFVDESKSGTRRWCDMTSCGNRAKAQRHYARVKQA